MILIFFVTYTIQQHKYKNFLKKKKSSTQKKRPRVGSNHQPFG